MSERAWFHWRGTDIVKLLVASVAGCAIVASILVACKSYWSIATYIRTAHQREGEVTQAARLDGVRLATTTLQHHIGNKLAVTVGYGEMLLDDPRLPPDLQEYAQKMLNSAMAAAAVVHKFDQQVIHIELDHRVTGPAVLDVDGSTLTLTNCGEQRHLVVAPD
jgi:hypothetical protein